MASKDLESKTQKEHFLAKGFTHLFDKKEENAETITEEKQKESNDNDPTSTQPVVHKGKNIGNVWKNSDGEWEGEHSGTGMSWSTDNRKAIEDMIKDHHDSWIYNKSLKEEK